MKKSQISKKTAQTAAPPDDQGRSRILQSTFPLRDLEDAMKVAQAILDNFGGGSAAPHQVAMALDLSPTSSGWRYLTGAAVAYGLTTAAYNAPSIALTALGRRCISPTEEGDDKRALQEACLKPSGLRDFFAKYNRSKLPQDKIAKNVLQHDLGVPRERVDACLQIIKNNGQQVGIIQETKTGPFVALDGSIGLRLDSEVVQPSTDPAEEALTEVKPTCAVVEAAKLRDFKVFISHGHNLAIVEQVKDILSLYDIEHEVAVEEESPAIPVSNKVTDAMRRCSAGIMVVSREEGNDIAPNAINDNVLIEIGAAFVLYDKRVVLLWEKPLPIPSNLQGLYRCEFEGGELSFGVGTRLAKAVKSFRDQR